ncbi:Multidrug resistance-associated protein 1 [Paramyrothecium foliicola]|nr:Multidrug resistance-associated protein 1 [Paramyrothecium foliicola]
MTSNDGKSFPPRKWYRRVPFISTKPIGETLRARNLHAAAKSDDGEHGPSAGVEERAPLPESTATWLSMLTFNWTGPVLRIGYTRPLQIDDMYDMPGNRLVVDHTERLEQSWSARLKKNTNRKISSGKLWRRPFWMRRTTNATVLALSLNDVCLRWFWLGGLFKLCANLSLMTSPLLIRYLIKTFSDHSQQALREGFGYAVALFLLFVFSVTSNVHGFYRSYTTGILLRGALMHAIYRRATTQLTEKAKLQQGFGTGKLMTLMSADVTRVDFCCGFFHSAWTSIVQILLSFALTTSLVGYNAIPGFALLALLYPLQSFTMRRILRLRRASMPFTDARVKAVIEAIATIRLIKTNAFEGSLLSKIGKLRSNEVRYIRKRMLLRASNTAVSYTAPALAAVVSIICYGATSSKGMEASVVFPVLTYFLLLRTPLLALPMALTAIADARAALERLASFMVTSDMAPASDSEIFTEPVERPLNDILVEIQAGNFVHFDDEVLSSDESSVDLQNIKSSVVTAPSNDVAKPPGQRLYLDSLIIKKNQLVCVMGPVASGKSSVFKAMLKNMQLIQARTYRVSHQHSASLSQVAFVPQTAWLLSETIRENIIFGRPLDLEWYNEVLVRCCLHEDLTRLPDGDMTIVGEMGISLSGGQKQRVGLARAIYGRNTLLLLDDCFSALDPHVGTRVFENVVKQAVRNGEATIVLITQSMDFASQSDHIVYMENGCIAEQGSYQLLSTRNGPFSLFKGSSSITQPGSAATLRDSYPEQLHDQSSEATETKIKDIAKDNIEDKQTRGTKIMQAEERYVGTVSSKTYIRYVGMGRGWITVPLCVASIFLYQGASIVSPLWLSWWQTTRYSFISKGAYMGGYAAFGIGQSLGLFCMSATFALFCFWCSNSLHQAAMFKVLHAPMAFFDTTPQGRITHRFSKDVDAVDNVVGEGLRLFILALVQVVGTIIIVAIVLPAFLAIAAAVLLAFIWTGMYYRPSSRELRRLTNLLRSRIYEHFSESLSGLPTIKAFGAVPRFVDDNARRIDTENTAYWLSVACQGWFNLRLDLFGAFLILATGLLVVGLRDSIDSSLGGVVLSYIVTTQSIFGNLIRQSAAIENNMNSVERMLHYVYNLEQEPAQEIDTSDKSLQAKKWPLVGRVQFQSVTLSHRPELEPAIRDVTLDVKPGENIGVVGRTAAGKTTLVSALLRLADPTSGNILIDEVDIRTIGLRLLRSNLSIINQDAILLNGTIRFNLDPFQWYDDDWLQECLKKVGFVASYLETAGDVNKHENKDQSNSFELEKINNLNPTKDSNALNLNWEVKENGANLSQGQKSLLSIARALVRRSRIVILDEATASIDKRADAALQVTLKEIMKEATVFTVAHRLETIVATCDRVVVLDAGRVVEFGSILELFSRPDGLFRALCDASNIGVSEG